jgi:hypothetical protein
MTRGCAFLWSALFVATSLPAAARGDGGVLRLTGQFGAYRVALFTRPVPFQAGPVDLSVLVQDATTGAPVPTARVVVSLTLRAGGAELRAPATYAAATNKLLRAALFDLPHAGWYDSEVLIEGPGGPATAHLELYAGPPPPRWIALWKWLALPALPIGAYAARLIVLARAAHRKLRIVRGVAGERRSDGR